MPIGAREIDGGIVPRSDKIGLLDIGELRRIEAAEINNQGRRDCLRPYNRFLESRSLDHEIKGRPGCFSRCAVTV